MKKKTAIGIAAVSVAGALAVGLGAVSSWFTNWDVNTWFGRGGGNAVVQPDDPDKPVDTDGMYLELNTPPEGSLLMVSLAEDNGVSTASNTSSSYDLVATFHPSISGRVNWSVAFANAESDWAKDKAVTDYVTVSSTGATTATIVCNAAFGEQIIVTAVYADDEKVKATCTADYKQRITKITPTLDVTVDGSEYGFMNGTPYFAKGETIYFDEMLYNVTLSDIYTVPLSGSLKLNFSIGLSDEFHKSLQNYITHGGAPGIISPVSAIIINNSTIGFNPAGERLTTTTLGMEAPLSVDCSTAAGFCSIYYRAMVDKTDSDVYVFNDNIVYYVNALNSLFDDPTLSSQGNAREWGHYTIQAGIDGAKYTFQDTFYVLRGYAKVSNPTVSLNTDKIVF